MRVNTMYGADGKLRTSYLEGKAAEAAKKNVKAFNRELARYEKDFTNYASLDIDSANVARTSTRYIFGKLNIAEKYIDYIPAGDMAQSMGDDMTAVAGNKAAFKLGVGSKIASVFQPFFEKQAAKHPKLQALSDNITKAANGGRMPLTADSAAVMKIAFDKKYYNDIRRPGVDKDELKAQYDSAVSNLMTMAASDGVDRKAMSAKMSEKLIQQMQIDESITDIYAGMADGGVRLGEDKPILNAKGEPITIKGKTLYQRSNNFVDKDGNEIDALSLSPREPQTIDEILSDYQAKLDKYAKSCKTEADFKKMLASDSYQNIERNAKVFAALDCPDEAEKFKYDFSRVNIESCRNWAIENDNKSPYAQLVVPPKFDEITAGNEFVRGYATSDYYNIDGVEDDYYTTDISGQAQDETRHMSDDELAESLKNDVVDSHEKLSDIEKLQERLDRLEAENKELRAQLFPDEEKKPDDYSVFRIESMGEVAYFRDNGIDIDGFLNRFAEIEAKTPVKYYDFVKDCQKITEIEYAESEQSRKNPPAFSADINLDDREFIVHKGNQFANVSLDDAIKSVKETGKANLEFEEFDYDYEDIDTAAVDADERSFDEILMDSSELPGVEYTSDSAADKPNAALSSKTEEKDAVSDAAKPSESVSRIGNYIGIGQRGREAFQEFKQRISEQFGSSGGTILPSNQNKRDYTVKPIEISTEYDSAKYIEEKPAELKPAVVSEKTIAAPESNTYKKLFDAIEEGKGTRIASHWEEHDMGDESWNDTDSLYAVDDSYVMCREGGYMYGKSYTKLSQEEADDIINQAKSGDFWQFTTDGKAIYGDTQSDKPKAAESSVNSAISRFSDTVIGYDESMDDYTDDDADFSP